MVLVVLSAKEARENKEGIQTMIIFTYISMLAFCQNGRNIYSNLLPSYASLFAICQVINRFSNK